MRNLMLLAALVASAAHADTRVIVRGDDYAVEYLGCSVVLADVDLSVREPHGTNDLAFGCTHSRDVLDPGAAGDAPTTRLQVACVEATYPNGDPQGNCGHLFTPTQDTGCRIDRLDTDGAVVFWRLDCGTLFADGFEAP